MQSAGHDRFVQSGCLDDDIVRAIESTVRLRPFVLLNCLEDCLDLCPCGHHPFSTIRSGRRLGPLPRLLASTYDPMTEATSLPHTGTMGGAASMIPLDFDVMTSGTERRSYRHL